MNIKVIIRCREFNLTKPIMIAYCGYLQFDDCEDMTIEGLISKCWEYCNWSCWSNSKPEACQNLLICYCNSDVSFEINGNWYSHKGYRFSSFDDCISEMKNPRSREFLAVWPPTENIKILHNL